MADVEVLPSPCGRGLGGGGRDPRPLPQPPPARGGGGTFVVVGIGNPDRGDDAVGRMVARLLRTRVPANSADRRARWRSDGAARGPAGSAPRLADRCRAVRRAARHDPSHRLLRHRCSRAARHRLVARLRRCRGDRACPRARHAAAACIVYAIEAAHFTPGAQPSPAVTQAAHEVAERILAGAGYSAAAFIPPPAASSACDRSPMMSSMCSMPTDSRM